MSDENVETAGKPRPRVVVLFGGRSSEHAVSCVTAAGVLGAIDKDKYDVIPIGIAKTGQWVLASGDTRQWSLSSSLLPEVEPSSNTVTLAEIGGEHQLIVASPNQIPQELGTVDVVFPLLHGPFGEDGTIQGLLELSDTRYVGAGVLASAVGMDKHYMKVVFQAHGLPVLPYTVITPRGWEADRSACHESVDSLGYPVFVKPCRGGSSIGISKVHDASELDAAVEEARRHDPKVLVETAAEGGREIECGVIEGFGSNPPDTSVVAEITIGGGHEFYDFAAKYLPEEHTRLDVPADVPEQVAAEVRDLSARAFEALSCEGLARVDFFLLADDRLVINEINTMPGFTPSSMFPRMWAATGLDYPALVDRLVQLALHRDTGLR